jgi:hypothetical protein
MPAAIRVGTLAVLLLSLAVLITSGGSGVAALAVPFLISILVATILYPEIGIALLALSIVLFDQFTLPEFQDSFSFRIKYFTNLQDVPYLPRFEGASFTMFELHLLLVVAAWTFSLLFRSGPRVHPLPFRGLLLLLIIWVVSSFVRGLSSGGMMLPALWETRAIAYFFILYAFIPQVIVSVQAVKFVIGSLGLALLIKSVQAVRNGMAFGLNFEVTPYLTASQEDALLFIVGIGFIIALKIFGSDLLSRPRRIFLLAAFAVAIFLGNRRSVYVAAIVMFISFMASLPTAEFRRSIRRIVLFFIGGVIYLAVFWNVPGVLGHPARQVQSVVFSDEEEITERNRSSNDYRKRELYNLSFNIRNSPAIGLGYGVPYEAPINLHLVFGLSEYIAHNSLIWFMMRVGSVGFAIFFVFIGFFIYHTVMKMQTMHDPYLKAVALTGILFPISQVVVAFAEMHFTYYRNMSLLGLSMGLAVVAMRLDAFNEQSQPPPAEIHQA